VAEVASLTGAEPREGADLSRRLSGIAPVDQAGAGDLTFVADAKFAAALESTKAGAVLTSERFARHVPDGVAVLRTRNLIMTLSWLRARFTAARFGAVWGGFPAKPKRQWMREVVVLARLAAGGRGKSRGRRAKS
jgi:UDP-3-O-[3-hydroxymyristoyl] glucosamine N-acyltransferase